MFALLILSTVCSYCNFCLDSQYDEHLTTLEQKIKLVQERAEVDSSSWYGGDDDQNQEVKIDRIISLLETLLLKMQVTRKGRSAIQYLSLWDPE